MRIRKITKTDHHIINLVGIARKSGKTVSGFEKVKRSIEKGDISLIFINHSLSANTMDRLHYYVRKKPISLIQTSRDLDWKKNWGIETHKILGIIKSGIGRNLSKIINSGV